MNSACSRGLAAPERADLEPHRDDRDDDQQQDHDDAGVAARRDAGDAVEQVAGALQQPAHQPLDQAGTGVPVDLLGQLLAGQLGRLVPAELDRDGSDPQRSLRDDGSDHRRGIGDAAGATPAARASSMSSASRRIRRST